MNQKEFDEGYKAAIEAIKQQQNGNSSGSSSNGSDGPEGSKSGGKGNGNKNKDNSNDRSKDNSTGGAGQVTANDCTPLDPSDGGSVGSFADRDQGKKLAKQEGYEDNEGSTENLANDWKNDSLKNMSKLRGSAAGALQSKINSIYNTTTDWKKTLKHIIGSALNPAAQDYRFTSKNTLVTQDRIARTDKDKWDNIDKIICFIDSSGSMSDDMLRKVLSEVYSLANQKKPMYVVTIQCDTKIQEVKVFNNINSIKKEFSSATVKGRGGTELKPCWNLLREDKRFKGRLNELVLVFTDGYLTQYARDRKTMQNLCWCIIDNPGFKVEKPDRNTKCIYFDTKKM